MRSFAIGPRAVTCRGRAKASAPKTSAREALRKARATAIVHEALAVVRTARDDEKANLAANGAAVASVDAMVEHATTAAELAVNVHRVIVRKVIVRRVIVRRAIAHRLIARLVIAAR